jgi:hypothetical protein
MHSPSTSALSFFMHTILICYSCSQVSEFWHTFKRSVVHSVHDIQHDTWVPSVHISRSTCLPLTNKVLLFWTVCIYSFTQLITFYQHRPKAYVCLAISVLPGLFEASYRQLTATAKWTPCWHDKQWAMPLEVWSYAGLKWLLLSLNFLNLLI